MPGKPEVLRRHLATCNKAAPYSQLHALQEQAKRAGSGTQSVGTIAAFDCSRRHSRQKCLRFDPCASFLLSAFTPFAIRLGSVPFLPEHWCMLIRDAGPVLQGDQPTVAQCSHPEQPDAVGFDDITIAAEQAAGHAKLSFVCLSQDMHRAFLNVGYVLSEKQLRAHFAQFGLVSDTYLPKHTSGRNKGFGFVTFDSAQALDRALLTPAHVIDGVTVQV